MSETFPKATEVRMAANLLAITFDNGQTATCAPTL